jgi:hypothetical protein
MPGRQRAPARRAGALPTRPLPSIGLAKERPSTQYGRSSARPVSNRYPRRRLWRARRLWPSPGVGARRRRLVSVSVSFAGVRGSPPVVAEGRRAGQMAWGGRRRTVVLRTEKRKVGGSTPPLTTTTLFAFDLRKWQAEQGRGVASAVPVGPRSPQTPHSWQVPERLLWWLPDACRCVCVFDIGPDGVLLRALALIAGQSSPWADAA